MYEGFVYVLINPSLKGLVKIGKTTLDPEERAKELSSSTGVPTDFYVAYKVFVEDCDATEKYIHTLLDEKGFRLNRSREFFTAPLDVVIDIMVSLKSVKTIKKESISVTEDFHYLIENNPPAYAELLEEADSYYFGSGEHIQDFEEAIRYYKNAIKLGSLDAYSILGDIFVNGDGCNIDYKYASELFKEGIRKGNENCYADLGNLYLLKGQLENAKKCYDKYFNSNTFKEKITFYTANPRLRFINRYFFAIINYGFEYSYKEEIVACKEEIEKDYEFIVRHYEEIGNIEYLEVYKDMMRDVSKNYGLGIIVD